MGLTRQRQASGGGYTLVLDSTDVPALRKRRKETTCPSSTKFAVRSEDLSDMNGSINTRETPRKGKNEGDHIDGHGELLSEGLSLSALNTSNWKC